MNGEAQKKIKTWIFLFEERYLY